MSTDEGQDNTEDQREAEASDDEKPAMPPGARAVAETDETIKDADKADGA